VADELVDFYCSRTSADVRERIFGTASRVDVWLLLEYNGRWSPDLLADSHLPTDVKGALSSVLGSVRWSRLVFVKNELRGLAGLSFFVAITREDRRALHRFELDDYRDLLSIDVASLVAGATSDEQGLSDPLFLVCLDGKHDKCCAKFGLPVYRAMVRWAGDAVWQSSHLGGDRFAANVVCLPSGVYYGHVTPPEAPRLVHDTAAGLVYLDKYRGRSCHSFDVQAAEYFARVASGVDRADAFSLRDVSRSDNLIRVSLAETAGARVHVLELARDPAAFHHFLTCHSPGPADVPQYTLRAYHVEPAPTDA
jgi:hypothetical protein